MMYYNNIFIFMCKHCISHFHIIKVIYDLGVKARILRENQVINKAADALAPYVNKTSAALTLTFCDIGKSLS